MTSSPPSPSPSARQAKPAPSPPPQDIVYSRTSPRPQETASSRRDVILGRKAAVQLSWDDVTLEAQLELRHDLGLRRGFIRLRLFNIALHETRGVQSFYIFIPPESIRSMMLVSPAVEHGPGATTSAPSGSCVHRLGFDLSQPLDVVGPNCSWTGRDADSIKKVEHLAGLASATSLVVLVPTRVARLAQWEAFCAVASQGLMRSMVPLYNIETLYGGKGGRRHESVAPDAGHLPPSYPCTTATEAGLPPYVGPSDSAAPATSTASTVSRSLKRARRSSSPQAEAESFRSPKREETRPRVNPDRPHLVEHAALVQLQATLTEHIDHQVTRLKRQLENMSQHINARLDRLEERIADQEQRDLVEEADERLERLVDQYVNDAKEDLEENTTYQVDAELDDLRLYLDAEMQEKAGEWMDSMVETIKSASIRLDFSN